MLKIWLKFQNFDDEFDHIYDMLGLNDDILDEINEQLDELHLGLKLSTILQLR